MIIDHFLRNRTMKSFKAVSFVFLLFNIFSFVTSQTDPCSNPEDISNNLRNPSEIFRSGAIALCDRYLNPDLWYDLGGKITQECVPLQKCSTYSGIWYNGTYPIGNEIVSGKVCAINKANDCCGWSGFIQIKKCSNNTYVHKLSLPTSCPISYCVEPCLDEQVYYHSYSQSCWNVPVINTTTLSKPYISAFKLSTTDSGPFNTTAFSVDCETNLVGYISPSNSTAKLKIEAIFKMDKDVVFSSTNEFSTKVSVKEKYLIGHLGKSLSCALRFYYEFNDGSQSTKTDWVNSTGYFMGIQPVDLNGNVLSELILAQGETMKINFKATFPITTMHCLNDEYCWMPVYDFHMINSYVCTANCDIYFGTSNGSISYTSWPTVEISVVNTPGQEYTTTEIQFSSFFSDDYPENLFQGYTIPQVMIRVEENKTQPACHSIGCSHVLTFSNLGFENNSTGDFYLLKAKNRTFEIQLRQIPCLYDSNFTTCTCGIIVREDNYIIGVTACDYNPAPTIFELKKDPVNPNVTLDINRNTYTIRFVSGMTITLEISGSFMDIYITALKNEEYEGFCSVVENDKDFNVHKVPFQKSFFKKFFPSCVNKSSGFSLCKCKNVENNTNENESETRGPNNTQIKYQIIQFEDVCNSNEDNGLTIEDVFRSINISIDSLKSVQVFTNYSSGVALQTCETCFKSFAMYNECVEILGKIFENLKNNCIDDIRLTGNTLFANIYLNVFGQVCKQNLEKQFIITNGTLSSSSLVLYKLLEEIEASICPVCLNYGKCVNGSCICSPGFGEIDCSVDLNKPPVISLFSNNSFCDISSQPCRLINLRTRNLNWMGNNTKACTGYIIDGNGTTTGIDMSALLIQPGLLQCSINMETFNQTIQQQSKIKLILKVTTSNGVKMLESNELNLTIFDGSCLNCSSDTCILKENTCNINNVCYEAGYAKYEDHQCIPSLSVDHWSTCSWNSMSNANSPGGTQQSCTTLDQCKFQCLAMKDTICKYGFDWNPADPSGFQYWFSTSAEMSKYAGVEHYSYQCTSEKITTPPPKACLWSSMKNTNSPGGIQQSYTTLDQCQSQCLTMKDTTCAFGFDWNLADPIGFQCWFSTSTSWSTYNGVYHYTYQCTPEEIATKKSSRR